MSAAECPRDHSTRSASSRGTPPSVSTACLVSPLLAPASGNHGGPDDRFIYLSDLLPTAWQAVEYAGVPHGGSLLILDLRPIGDMASRIAQQKWIDEIIGMDLVDERLTRARPRCIQVIDLRDDEDDLADVVRGLTDGRGPDSVIDAVGMEAHVPPASRSARAQR